MIFAFHCKKQRLLSRRASRPGFLLGPPGSSLGLLLGPSLWALLAPGRLWVPFLGPWPHKYYNICHRQIAVAEFSPCTGGDSREMDMDRPCIRGSTRVPLGPSWLLLVAPSWFPLGLSCLLAAPVWVPSWTLAASI